MDYSRKLMSPNPMKISLKRNKSNRIMTTPTQFSATTIRYHPQMKQNDINDRFNNNSTIKNQQSTSSKTKQYKNSSYFAKYNQKAVNYSDAQFKQQLQTLNTFINQAYASGIRQELDPIKYNAHSYINFNNNANTNIDNKIHQGFKKFNISTQYPKLPQIIKQIYEQEKNKQTENQGIHFTDGYIKEIGYFYYGIQKKLVLLSYQSLLNYSDIQTLRNTMTVFEFDMPVISVNLIQIGETKLEHRQIHPLGQIKRLIIVSNNWQINLFSYQQRPNIQFRPLNIKINMPSQICKQFDYSKNGQIYYIDENCQIGRLKIVPQWNCLKKNQFSVKNLIFQSAFHTNRRKYVDNQYDKSFLSTVFEKYQDMKYIFKKKNSKPLQIIIEKQQNMLYILTRTYIQNQLRTAHREIRIYQIQQPPKSTLDKLPWNIYKQHPILIRTISEEEIYHNLGEHLFLHLNARNFIIKGIHLLRRNVKPTANILIILQNGSRIYLDMLQDKFVLIEVIHLPDIQKIREGGNQNALILTQKQPIDLKIIDYCMHANSWVIVVNHSRKIFSLLVSRIDQNRQQVQIIWDSAKSNENKFFINSANYKIYKIPLFLAYMSPKKYIYSYILKGSQTSFKLQKFWSNRQSYIITQQQNIRLVRLMSPIDILFQLIYNMESKYTIYSTNARLESIQKQLKQSIPQISEIEILQLLLKIYTDTEGVYLYRVNKQGFLNNPKKVQNSINYHKNNQFFVTQKFVDIQDSFIFSKIQQIFLDTRNPQSQQTAIMNFLSKLFLPIWKMKIYEVKKIVYLYYRSILLRILKLIQNSNLYCNQQTFVRHLLQSIQMIKQVNQLAYVPVQDILNCNSQVMQQPLFLCFVKNRYKGHILKKWKQSFPNYISNQLIQAIKLSAELSSKSQQEIKKIFFVESQKIPFYLISYFYNIGKISKQALNSMLLKITSVNKIDVRQISPPPNLSPQQKFKYCLKELKKSCYTWNQKRYLLVTAQHNLLSIKTHNPNCIMKKQSQLVELKRILSFQKLLQNRIDKLVQNKFPLSNEIVQAINHLTLNKQELHKLINLLDIPQIKHLYISDIKNLGISDIKFIFFVLFGDNLQALKQSMISLFQTLLINLNIDSGNSSQSLHKNVRIIFNQITDISITKNIPMKGLFQQLNKMVYGILEVQQLFSQIKSRGFQMRLKQIFWVPFQLYQWGYAPITIFNELKLQIQKNNGRKTLQYFLINIFLFVKLQYHQCRKQLQVFMERVQQTKNINKQDLSLLTKFL